MPAPTAKQSSSSKSPAVSAKPQGVSKKSSHPAVMASKSPVPYNPVAAALAAGEALPIHKKTNRNYASFKSSVGKILNDLRKTEDLAKTGVSLAAFLVFESLIISLLTRIAEKAKSLLIENKRSTMTSKEIRAASKLVLPSGCEISEFSIEYADATLKKFQLATAETNKASRERKAASKDGSSSSADDVSAPAKAVSDKLLHFQVSKVRSFLRKGFFGRRLSPSAPVYLAAVLENIMFDIMTHAMRHVKDLDVKRILPQHLTEILHNDDEMSQLFQNCFIAGGGVPKRYIMYKQKTIRRSSTKSKDSTGAHSDDHDGTGGDDADN